MAALSTVPVPTREESMYAVPMSAQYEENDVYLAKTWNSGYLVLLFVVANEVRIRNGLDPILCM